MKKIIALILLSGLFIFLGIHCFRLAFREHKKQIQQPNYEVDKKMYIIVLFITIIFIAFIMLYEAFYTFKTLEE